MKIEGPRQEEGTDGGGWLAASVLSLPLLHGYGVADVYGYGMEQGKRCLSGKIGISQGRLEERMRVRQKEQKLGFVRR